MATVTLPSITTLIANLPTTNTSGAMMEKVYYLQPATTNTATTPRSTSPTNTTTDGSKKRRTRTSKEQLVELMRLYHINPLPTAKQRQELGERIGMSPRSVQVWFQNKRQNMKKSDLSRSRSASPDVMEEESENEKDAVLALLGLASF